MVSKNESAIELTSKEFREIISSNKLVVVDFFAEWCMPCLIISPIIEELANKIEKVKFAKINVDDSKDLSKKYKIYSIPCLIIFKDGIEVDRIVGVQTADRIEEKIRGFL